MLCAMEPRLRLKRFLPQAGLEPGTAGSPMELPGLQDLKKPVISLVLEANRLIVGLWFYLSVSLSVSVCLPL